MLDELSRRPLSRHEERIRHLYELADSILNRLDVVSEAIDRMDRVDVLVNGDRGFPGLVEGVESLAFYTNRLQRTLEVAQCTVDSSQKNLSDGLVAKIIKYESNFDRLVGRIEEVDKMIENIMSGVRFVFYAFSLGVAIAVVALVTFVLSHLVWFNPVQL